MNGSSGPSSKVMATSLPSRGPWLIVPPNQLTVGVLAATHDMSRIAHVVATTPTPTVSRGAAEARGPRFTIMLPTAATTATTIAPPQRGGGVRPRRGAARPTPSAAGEAGQPPAVAPRRDRRHGQPDADAGQRGDADGDDAPRRDRDEERRRRATSSAPSHASRGRGTSRATAIASVTPMLIAATDVISAAVVPSVPQPAAGHRHRRPARHRR